LISVAFSEDTKVEGEIEATGYYIGVEGGEGGEAKFTEYKDLEEHWRLFGKVKIGADSEQYFLKFKGYDFGYDTQRYSLDGGLWGKFKLDLSYDEIPHNITFDARTFFSGAGRDTLVSPAVPSLNSNTWNTFDYSTERKKFGSGLKLDLIKPFFFNASYSREEKEGIKPAGIAPINLSPGSFSIEVPEPVDYTTNNINLEGGYAKNPFFLSFNYFYSSFENDKQVLHFTGNPAILDPDLTLPPDNRHYKFAFKGGVKLPFNSKFSTNLGTGKTTSDHDFFETFDGEVKTRNYDFVVTSNPVRFLDTKIYYKYYKRNNKSEQTEITNIDEIPHFFDYKLNTFGIDLGFRLPANFYFTPGYKYVKTEREFVGEDPERALPTNKDDIYSIELRWTGLDFATFKAGYERLNRDADFRTFEANFITAEGDFANRFTYAEQDRDTFKISADIYPTDRLSFGLGYKHRRTDYEDEILDRIVGLDTTLGLKKDKRNEFNFNVDYVLGKFAKPFGYIDYEIIKLDNLHFKFPSGFSPGEGFWGLEEKEKTWGYGIGTDLYVIPNKLTLVLFHDFIKGNGFSDFTVFNPGVFPSAGPGANNENIDISRLDDYTKWGLNFKAVYQVTKALAVSAGYGYERFRYKDAQLDDYLFVVPSGENPAAAGSNGAFLTGALKDLSYKAHLIFVGAAFKF
jgi:MtrB/PioB family decaheme-associated outer membrane protein